MIVPSIDLSNGKVVQLIQGEKPALERSDIADIADYFSLFGPLAVIDLDAARGIGTNRDLVRQLARTYDCRVGGGLREPQQVEEMLRAGAAKVIVGTRATPEFLRPFNPDQIIAAVDVKGGQVVDHGWRQGTGKDPLDLIGELNDYCSEFLITHVDVEGTMGGLDQAFFLRLAKATQKTITIAGGARSIEDLQWAHDHGFNVQLGMSIYTGAIKLEEAMVAMVQFERGPKQLVPTIVQDQTGTVLMLAYSSPESLKQALETRRGVYYSRTRCEIWEKGATSGNCQRLKRVHLDCDRDTLLFIVEQDGDRACHQPGWYSCFGFRRQDVFGELMQTLLERIRGESKNSYTRTLIENPKLLAEKIREESGEVIDAPNLDNLVWEIADLVYFLSVAMARDDVVWKQVYNELQRRRR